jgi:CheY-like chemotaxis protein
MPQPIWRVVVADDHADTRDLYAEVLALMHFEVASAANGADALAICRAEPPHVVIADLRMPKVNGYELLDELRRDERTRGIPVIATSASLGEEARALAHGFEAFCAKPCDPQRSPARTIPSRSGPRPTGCGGASGTDANWSAGGRRSSPRAMPRASSPRRKVCRSTWCRRPAGARTTVRSAATA